MVFLALLAVAAAGARAEGAPARELFLAGGALGICSDLAPKSCTAPPAGGREPARYRLDDAGLARAAEAALWQAPGAPSAADLAALLGRARAVLGVRATAAAGIDAATLEAALDGVCLADRCVTHDPRRPWSIMLDVERAALLAALEQPAAASGAGAAPVPERADPARSRSAGGVRVIEAFVAAARARAGGRPRIAIVTASAFDPMEPVDFYRSLFEALGAEARWWPVDAAMAAARFELGACDALPRLRLERLRLAGREHVYPELAAEQARHCREGGAALPAVHGVFMAGGDQWRLRQAFFGRDGRPNPWLTSLRQAHASGRVVVGGTSAGAAVQSGAWMLSNGSVAAALSLPPRIEPPPEPGCARGGRCGAAAEDQLTLWAGGGLGLATDAIVDTHFSERARELRLLRAMEAADAGWGYGADEGSALHLRELAGRREIRAVGEHGGWVFLRRAGQRDRAIAWYLVPGATLVIEDDVAALRVDAGRPDGELRPGRLAASAFEPGALRELAQRLARRCGRGLELPAGAWRARLACGPDVAHWPGPADLAGIGPLELSLRRAPPAPAP